MMAAASVPVLMYHSVSDRATPAFQPYAVGPHQFREHMAVLADRGCRMLTLSQRAAAMRDHTSVADSNAVVLTFDDAFLDFHTTALPILAEFGFPATLYVPSAFVGLTSHWLQKEGEATRPIMSWSALAEAVDAGVEVGSHSRSHADLDLIGKHQLRAEVADSKSELEDQLQTSVVSFAYPFGHNNAAVRSELVTAGYSSGVAVRDLASSTESPYRLSRWTVPGDMSAPALARLLGRALGSRRRPSGSDARALVSTGLRRTGLKRHENAADRREPAVTRPSRAARRAGDGGYDTQHVMLVGSAGGHLAQLLALRPWWEGRRRHLGHLRHRRCVVAARRRRHRLRVSSDDSQHRQFAPQLRAGISRIDRPAPRPHRFDRSRRRHPLCRAGAHSGAAICVHRGRRSSEHSDDDRQDLLPVGGHLPRAMDRTAAAVSERVGDRRPHMKALA